MEDILERGELKEIRALFAFNRSNTDEEVLFKFNLWCRWGYPGYFMDERQENVIEDAPFHQLIDLGNIRVYRGKRPAFVDVAFRGAAKTTRTKLFLGFVIANDEDHYRRYMKVLSEDDANSVQIVTDVYNLFVNKRMRYYYPEVLEKTPEKRAETMSNFETATNVKLTAGTVGTKQRGHLQDEYRPDFIWCDDFESRVTLRSAVILNKVWNNMEEARTGLSRSGGMLYTCNYLSERGNVHKLLEKYPGDILIVPIQGKVMLRRTAGILDVRHEKGAPTWPAAYTPQQVKHILASADDPAGEYLSTPAAGGDVYFDRKAVDKQEKCEPVREVGGFKIFYEYDPSHRYGAGQDVGGGVKLDHSTSVFIDFTQFPARVVATYKSNTIKPMQFGDEIRRECAFFGNPITAPENNKFDTVIARLRHHKYPRIYVMYEKPTRAGGARRVREWGWNTNSLTNSTMMSALAKAVSDGHLELTDPDLIAEARAYTRDDMMDKEIDPRLATRHFDLLKAAAIAYQMRDLAETTEPDEDEEYQQPAYVPTSEYEETGRPAAGINPTPVFEEEGDTEEFTQPPYQGMSDFEHE